MYGAKCGEWKSVGFATRLSVSDQQMVVVERVEVLVVVEVVVDVVTKNSRGSLQ